MKMNFNWFIVAAGVSRLISERMERTHVRCHKFLNSKFDGQTFTPILVSEYGKERIAKSVAFLNVGPTSVPMKRHFGIAVLFASFFLCAGETTTNLLSIHLVDIPLENPEWPVDGSSRPDNLKLISPAVLADSDFVAFDVTNHTFVITPAAAKRLAQRIWHLDGWTNPFVYWNGSYDLIPLCVPFVLKASGEPIYVGAFWNWASSSSFNGPVVIPENSFIKTNQTETVTFSVRYWQPPPTVNDYRSDGRIVTVSNWFSSPMLTDHRNDERIVSAANKLFGHERQ